MGWDNDNKQELEINATMIYIPGFDFVTEGRDKGMELNCSGGALTNQVCKQITGQYGGGAAEVEGKGNKTLQPVPKIFYKTRPYNLFGIKTNFGVSFTTPSGLSMDWDGEGGGFLDDVMIMMVELNPVVSFKLSDHFAFAVGVRGLYSSGEFNNTLYVPITYTTTNGIAGINATIDAKGTTKVTQSSNAAAAGLGYNFAVTFRPFTESDFRVAVTYRTNIHMNMKGSLNATSYVDMGAMASGTIGMDADLTLSADLPPIVNVAFMKTFGRLQTEFVIEKTYYGSADIFEFSYGNQKFTNNVSGSICAAYLGSNCLSWVDTSDYIDPKEMLGAADYSAVAYGNGWKDAMAYRLGLTFNYSPKLKLMGSFAYDKTPAPQGQFGIPDANAYVFGAGLRYQIWNGKGDIGIAYNMALKDNSKSFVQSKDGMGQLQLLTMGAKYRF